MPKPHKSGAPYVVIKSGELIQAGILLNEHLHKQETGLWRYDSDWSDLKVAATVGRIDEGHIARLRKQLDMPLERHVGPHGAVGTAMRVDELIKQHNLLCIALQNAQVLHDAEQFTVEV